MKPQERLATNKLEANSKKFETILKRKSLMTKTDPQKPLFPPELDSATSAPAEQPETLSPQEAQKSSPEPPAGWFLTDPRFAPQEHSTEPPEPLVGKNVWVVDAHALIHQLFHAMPEMTSPRGEPVGAVFGFARDIFFLWQEKKPDFLFVAIDVPGKTFRHQLYESYKAHRPELPQDLITQMELVYQLIDALGLPLVGCLGYEADDLMATIARLTEEHGGNCYLVTGDKDCRQLLSDHVFLFNIRKDQLFDRAALRAEWGIQPEQVVDFQALVGDSTDNVPGVPKIGPATARQILERFGSLDAALKAGGEGLKPAVRDALRTHKDQALLSRDLVRLDRHVPAAIDWRPLRAEQIDGGKARAIFQRMGFRSLLSKLDELLPKTTAIRAITPATPRRNLVNTPEAFQELLNHLQAQPKIAIDTETTNIRPRWANLVGLSLACCTEEGWYLPVQAPLGEPCLPLKTVIKGLAPILENPAVEKVGQNLKYDLVVLRGAGMRVQGISFDCMVASYLLDPGGRTHGLDELARRYLSYETIKISQLIGTGRKQRSMAEVPLDQITPYAVDDAVLPLRLEPVLSNRLRESGLHQLFREVEMPLVEVLAEMEFTGVCVNTARLTDLGTQLRQKLAELEGEIYWLAGRSFNIDSPKQLQEILFVHLGLSARKRTASGLSTDSEVLEELVTEHPIAAKLLEYRQLAKLLSTYVDALPRMLHPQTGRIHASFHQAVTATGRLSSSDPNLQNIPVRTPEGRAIRWAFIPGRPDGQLISADYSQIELRVLAHFTEDEGLCEAFQRDEDIHARVASRIYGVPLEEVTPEMRRRAKTVNFGVIYGQTPFGLAKQLGISKEEAAAFIDAYFANYPRIDPFFNRVLAECRQRGYVTTILGRRRPIEGVRERPGRQKNLAERTAINTVIQGSAADLIKLAMLGVHRELSASNSPQNSSAALLIQIHDELVFEVPGEHSHKLARRIAEIMSRVYPLKVPLKVDVLIGPNWGELSPPV